MKRLLGISYEQLEQLIEQGKILHQIKQDKNEKQKTRIIKAGGGKPAKLSIEEQIVLTLVYLRHHPLEKERLAEVADNLHQLAVEQWEKINSNSRIVRSHRLWIIRFKSPIVQEAQMLMD